MRARPHISVTCDCGSSGDADPGEAWRCDACGQLWRLGDPPRSLVEAAARLDRVHRRRTVASLVGIGLACLLPAATGDRVAFALAAPGALAAWSLTVLPRLRRRYRTALDALPAWSVRG